ncbi:MAG: peptidyl-prolyl cis-trans isomerase [Pseudomonadota bacterium]
MRLPREPLLYFLAIGAGVFLLSAWTGDDRPRRVVVDDARRARLADQWQAQMGRRPDEAELQSLVDEWVREEIYYREARAMGLDQDDVIIRRRLAQKLKFLTEDLTSGGTPDEAALRRFYREHAERYREPARYSLSHVYFSGDRRDDAEADARAALAAGAREDAPAGDPFMLQRSYAERSEREIRELFGAAFAETVAGLAPGEWHGPVRSAYGWHLVEVDARRPARRLAFSEVADRVAADRRQARRREANDAYYRSLRENYRVERR